MFLFLFCWLDSYSKGDTCTLKASFFPKRDTVVAANFLQVLTNTTQGATQFTWLGNNDTRYFSSQTEPVSGTFSAGVGINQFALAVSNGICKDTARMYVVVTGTPPSDKSSFQLSFGRTNATSRATTIDKLDNNKYVIGGYLEYITGPPNYNTYQKGFISVIDEEGCIQWSRRLGKTSDVVTLVKKAANGDIFCKVGSTLMRINAANGEVKWSRNMTAGSGFSFTEDTDGSIILCWGGAGVSLTKLDANGGLLLSSTVVTAVTNTSVSPRSVISLNGNYYICGDFINTTTLAGQAFVIAANANLTLQWSKWYQSTPNQYYPIVFREIIYYQNQLLINARIDNKQAFVYLGQDGSYIKSNLLNVSEADVNNSIVPVQPVGSHIIPLSNGDLAFFMLGYQTLSLQPGYHYHNIYMRIHNDNQILWQNNIRNYYRDQFSDIAVSSNSSILSVGQSTASTPGVASDKNASLIKINSNGDFPANCNAYTSNYTISGLACTVSAAAWSTNNPNFSVAVNAYDPAMENLTLQRKWMCPVAIDSCSLLLIQGRTDICDIAKTYTYSVHRTGGCTFTSSGTPGVQIGLITDSTVTVSFTRTGMQTIKIRSNNTCIPLEDSINVLVSPRTYNLTIGRDTLICKGASFQLNPGNSFISYRWQDGSTGSSYTVKDTGTYTVTMFDSCGNGASTGIHVGAAPYEIKEIFPDKNICTGDSVVFNLPAGYSGFSISPLSGIIGSATNSRVTVRPLVTTRYSFVVNNNTGCGVFDTANIALNPYYAVNLGNDTSLCRGQKILLNPENINYKSYQWSNGSSGSQIIVSDKGSYSLKVTDKNNCTYSDTLVVKDIKELPSIVFPADSIVCEGKNIILSTPPSMKNIVWQDGSSQTVFSVKEAGKYWVTVTDVSNCISSDTLIVKQKISEPSRFLTMDTVICRYDSVLLTCRIPFEKYLWSNNTTKPVLPVGRDGQYWVNVIDKYGCSWKEQVNVGVKECYQEIYFPSGFSPNHDGLNDLFRATLYGRIEFYRLAIYTRSGQKIFESTDVTKAWDGTIKGQLQNQGTFVWVAEYRFPGQQNKIQKGTISLIR